MWAHWIGEPCGMNRVSEVGSWTCVQPVQHHVVVCHHLHGRGGQLCPAAAHRVSACCYKIEADVQCGTA